MDAGLCLMTGILAASVVLIAVFVVRESPQPPPPPAETWKWQPRGKWAVRELAGKEIKQILTACASRPPFRAGYGDVGDVDRRLVNGHAALAFEYGLHVSREAGAFTRGWIEWTTVYAIAVEPPRHDLEFYPYDMHGYGVINDRTVRRVSREFDKAFRAESSRPQTAERLLRSHSDWILRDRRFRSWPVRFTNRWLMTWHEGPIAPADRPQAFVFLTEVDRRLR
ncbi:MAG: hypothetical protein ACRDXX_16265 [Stackebrandtia sp.]